MPRRTGVGSQRLLMIISSIAFSGGWLISEFLDKACLNCRQDAVTYQFLQFPRIFDVVDLIISEKCYDVSSLLRRRNNNSAFTKSSAQRKRQAKEFFKIAGKVDKNKRYIIIDDIFTTGSTKGGGGMFEEKWCQTRTLVVIARHGRPNWVMIMTAAMGFLGRDTIVLG